MEKLIELFKQHKRETGTSYEYILFRDDDAGLQARCIDDGKEIYIVRQAEILSKKMGFIERLVENKKIDFDNRDLKDEFMLEFERYPVFQGNTYNRDFNINGLLMLLAIQDDPIKFLISVLK